MKTGSHQNSWLLVLDTYTLPLMVGTLTLVLHWICGNYFAYKENLKKENKWNARKECIRK